MVDEHTVFDFDAAVARECERQSELKAQGRFEYVIGECDPYRSVAILTEEIGEVARAVNDSKPAHLREELIQVAACCRSWVSFLDKMCK